MRTLAVVIAVAVAMSSPSIAFAAKKHKAAPAQTFDSLNKDGIKLMHDAFMWPAPAPAKKHGHKKMAKKK